MSSTTQLCARAAAARPAQHPCITYKSRAQAVSVEMGTLHMVEGSDFSAVAAFAHKS